MHTMWKGSISFGLVNIPIKMYAAIEEKNIRYRYLHRDCQSPIHMTRTCAHCKEEVPWDKVVKGFEYNEGEFVIMEEEDLKSLQPNTHKSRIEILDFVNLSEIDPIYFNKTYYLGTQDENNKAYALLRQVLKESKKIGISKITIRSKESLAIIRYYQEGIILETIFYPDEIRDIKQVPFVPEKSELLEKELKMAHQLIEHLTTEFQPKKYQNDYKKAVEKAIERKVSEDDVVQMPHKQPEKIVDLMEALQASIETSSKNRKKSGIKRKKETS